MIVPPAAEPIWPALPVERWQDTLSTLHRWLQIAGKIRMKQGPHLNHWWEVTLYVTERGLTTSTMPYAGGRAFTIDFDFIGHELNVRDCNAGTASFALEPMPVSAFYGRIMDALRSLGLDVCINTTPCEVADATAFELDEVHASYDREYAHRFWRVLLQTDRVFKAFRARFFGKVSPVHLFWGAPDLAVTRFSGRRAPPHPGGIPHMPDAATRDAYSHEVSSAGFWPGGNGTEAAFYSYAYPAPEGFERSSVRPEAAFWHEALREFILPYDAVREASDPDAMLLAFLQSTYEAAANLGRWDRDALEKQFP